MKTPFFLTLLTLMTFTALSANAMDISLKDYLSSPPNPVDLVLTKGQSKITKIISAQKGGVITLQTSNGDTVIVTFPPLSVQQDIEITLQENKTVSSQKLPKLANFVSVELSPDGTQLMQPAVLTFKPKQPFAMSTITPFTSNAKGEDAILATLKDSLNPAVIELSLQHFSNYTITTDPSVDEIIDQGLARTDALRVSNWLAKKILEAKRNGKNLQSQAFTQALQEIFNIQVLPTTKSINSCASSMAAAEAYLSWSRQVQLVGENETSFFPTGFSMDLASVLTTGADQCFEVAKKACYVDHQPLEVIRFALSMARQAALIGVPEVTDRFMDLAKKCNTFRFVMNSDFWMGESRQNSFGVTAKADFEFAVDFLSPNVPSIGTIEVVDTYVNFQGLVCTRLSLNTKPSEVTIQNFFPNPSNQDFKILLGGLIPYNDSTFDCRNPNGHGMKFTVPMGKSSSYWGGNFLTNHGPLGLNEWIPATAQFELKNWQVRADTRFAAKSYNFSNKGLNETTDIVIYHTPKSL